MVFESFCGSDNAVLTAIFSGVRDEVELLVFNSP